MPTKMNRSLLPQPRVVSERVMRFVGPIAVLICSVWLSGLWAQQPTRGTLAWDQDAPNLATAQAYEYRLEIDGHSERLLTSVRCIGDTPAFACSAPLPEIGDGPHSLAIRATEAGNPALTSSLSNSFVAIVLNGTTLACSPVAPAGIPVQMKTPHVQGHQ